jgi:hypothetical protein
VSRRGFLGGLGAVRATSLVPGGAAEAVPRSAATSATPSGLSALTAAMHVHAAWSEQDASWRAQFDQASRNGVDVIWMTDHDHCALAEGFLTNLNNCPMVLATTGSLASRTATNSSGTIRVAATSGNASPASVHYSIQDLKARNFLRTGISGTTVDLTFGSGQLGSGGYFDVVAHLSYRPAQAGRPSGTYSIRYRFEALPTGYSVEADGLTGRVSLALPPAGTLRHLDLAGDFGRLWPQLLAVDNGFHGLEFIATSPRAGVTVDCALQTVGFTRTQNVQAAIVANQQHIASAYLADFPALTAQQSVEVSMGPNAIPHCNLYGCPPQYRAKKGLTVDTYGPTYDSIIAQAHTQGGVVSWNHPFGPTGGPVAADQDADRRAVFGTMWGNDLHGSDILEVGYTLRGYHDFPSHLALWDTFSRRGRFLTGNGANDDHTGRHWAGAGNGFVTGLWAPSTSAQELTAALAGGRAYTLHPARWPDGAVDLFSGPAVMGHVDVYSAANRLVTVYCENLPNSSTVEVVRGAVDYSGSDPLNTIIRLPASAFGSAHSGAVTVQIDTTTECFVRVQVRLSTGLLVGTSNPLWLLKKPPPGGVPTGRAVPR